MPNDEKEGKGDLSQTGIVKMKGKPGRKSLMTKETCDKLEEAFRLNFTVERACAIAGISTEPYYNAIGKDEKLHKRFKAAKEHASSLARSTVHKAMERGDGHLALKYLERADKEQFSTKTESEHREQITINLVSFTEKPREYIEVKEVKGELQTGKVKVFESEEEIATKRRRHVEDAKKELQDYTTKE